MRGVVRVPDLGGAISAVGNGRLLVAFLAAIVLVYWLVERMFGEDDDATIRMSSSSETGSTSFLVSGTHAAMLVGGVILLALGPEVLAGRWAVAAFVGLAVLGIWYFNKEERR
jgi:hypothetical protein